MVRYRSLKNGFILFAICWGLFLLNKAFVAFPEPLPPPLPTQTCEPQMEKLDVSEAVCTADGGRAMKCFRSQDEFYFPFSFLKKQFGISGKYSKDTFEWQTSYARVRAPDGSSYDPFGPFGHFSTYNVENRERVRCISAVTGVPMSTQWDSVPYYYPIQIAQYGLQHYSRLKLENSTKSSALLGTKTKEWKGSPGEANTSERLFFEDEEKGPVVNITSPENVVNPGGYLFLDPDSSLSVVSLYWRPIENASFTILSRVSATNKLILLNYVTGSDPKCVALDDGSKVTDEQISFTYWLGESNQSWTKITRDVFVDAARAMSSVASVKKKEGNIIYHPGDMKLITIGFHGKVQIQQRISQSPAAHETFFLTASNWLVENQNLQGGWSVPVERAIADRRLVLPAGWHSAMAQGHGLSLLSRAFLHSKDQKYLFSCVEALRLFEKEAQEGGVVNKLFGHTWYEEYPTSPGSFVLNGFMYSLIGLHDFRSIPQEKIDNSTIIEAIKKASNLFEKGINSLKTFLPLYDTGSGSVYDLRHLGLKTAPNLARWDYHAVHVYLLKWLVQITGDKELDETAVRWIGYSYGKRAKHN